MMHKKRVVNGHFLCATYHAKYLGLSWTIVLCQQNRDIGSCSLLLDEGTSLHQEVQLEYFKSCGFVSHLG